jgi:uncharacterized membrane protein (UPF0127 family)
MQLFSLILMVAALTTIDVRLSSGKVMKVEVATEGDDIARGLIGRESLPMDSGLLIAYRGDVQTKYTLMGYRFSIDILYIDESKTIVNLKENAVPCRTPECGYPSIWPYRYALMVPAGTVKRLNIHAGDVLSFNVPGETVSSTPKSTNSTIRLTLP